MFRLFRREPEKPNYAKIFAITVAVVAAASAVALVIFKLFNKYCSIGAECEGFLEDDCDDCDCDCCEVSVEDEDDAGEAEADAAEEDPAADK